MQHHISEDCSLCIHCCKIVKSHVGQNSCILKSDSKTSLISWTLGTGNFLLIVCFKESVTVYFSEKPIYWLLGMPKSLPLLTLLI